MTPVLKLSSDFLNPDGHKTTFAHDSSATESLGTKNGKFYKDHVITQSLP